MLTFLNQRQQGFFACACVRRIWHLIQNESSRIAVEVAELYLLGRGTKKAVRLAADTARDVYDAGYSANAGNPADSAAVNAADAVAAIGGYPAVYTAHAATEAAEASDGERQAQATLIREIANPFRPVALNPAWQTPTVLVLAQAAYENRILPGGTLEPARLAVLADALEETGCANADILNHLREPREHVRGCWVVDLLLGKE
jgi:hypothetical protein